MKTLKETLVQEGLIKRQAGMDIKNKIEAWLHEHKIKNYTINDDLTIDVNGRVDLSHYTEKQLPNYIQFGKVTSTFSIMISPNLESLKGCSKEVGGHFNCSGCPKLESLEGAPENVGLEFCCNGCYKLKSLEGAPENVDGDFWCRKCGKQFTEDDVKKVSKVKGRINV